VLPTYHNLSSTLVLFLSFKVTKFELSTNFVYLTGFKDVRLLLSSTIIEFLFHLVSKSNFELYFGHPVSSFRCVSAREKDFLL